MAIGITRTKYTYRVFSAAELKALVATPLSVISAPGLGKVVQVLGGIMLFQYGTVAYTSPGTLQLRYTNGSGQQASQPASGFMDATEDVMCPFDGLDYFVTSTYLSDQPVMFCNTNSSEMATGDSILNVKIAYRIITTGF